MFSRVFSKKCYFSKNEYTLWPPQKEWVAFFGNFLHSEFSPMYPVYTNFENLAKYHLGKKLGRFLKAIFFSCLARFICGYCNCNLPIFKIVVFIAIQSLFSFTQKVIFMVPDF